jgi:hypothetical protein
MTGDLRDLPSPVANRSGWPWCASPRPLAAAMPDGRAWPRIGIVTPSFQYGEYVERTIRSVLLQGYAGLEYAVVDGGSTDGTRAIMERYAPWLTWCVSEPDGGQSNAINKGLQHVAGDLVGWVNADDYLLPGALQSIAELYVGNPDAVAWIGGARVELPGNRAREDPPRVGTIEALADWGYGGYFWQPTCFFSRTAFSEVGGLDEALHYAMDFDLWMKLRRMGEFATMSKSVAAVSIRGEIKTLRDVPARDAETVYVCMRHGYPAAARSRMLHFLADAQMPRATMMKQLQRLPIRAATGLFLRRLAQSVNARLPFQPYFLDLCRKRN